MIIDMIPPEYWPQMRRELNAIGDAAISCRVAEATGKSPKEAEARRKRINAEYDEAIRRKQHEAAQESRRRSKERI